MAEYAPAAIRKLFTELDKRIPNVTLSGIVGDRAHTYGYHRARNVLPSSDYSRVLSYDKEGDGWAASAIDLSMSASNMKLLTGRLIKSAEDPDDPRMEPVREFFGTTNGSSVNGRRHDSPTGAWSFASSDSSHLWHIHISFFRKYANNEAALLGVMAVLAGIDLADTGGEDLPTPKDVWTHDPNRDGEGGVFNPKWRHDADTNKTITPSYALGAALDEAHRSRVAAEKAAMTCEAVLAALKGLDTEGIKAAVAEAAKTLAATQAESIADELAERIAE